MAVPCCHKELQRALAGRPAASWPLLAALLGHGILRQRTLDAATDALRAALLRAAGYRTDIVEFISAEHTPRNLLIRAVKVAGLEGGPGREAEAPPSGSADGVEAEEGDAAAAGSGSSSKGAGKGRATRSGDGGGVRLSAEQRAAVVEYCALRDYLGATAPPRLQVLLADIVEPLLAAAAAGR